MRLSLLAFACAVVTAVSLTGSATAVSVSTRVVPVTTVGELRSAIEVDHYADVIAENRRLATSVGIDAIPAHIFGRRYLVMGAQPYEVLKEVVDRLNPPG